MKCLNQIIFLIAAISAVSGRTLSNVSDTSIEFHNDHVNISKDLLRKSPKKFVPSITKNIEDEQKKSISKDVMESVTPSVETTTAEEVSEIQSAFLRPIFREDLPLGIFRSSVSGLNDRQRIELFRNREEEPVNIEETKEHFLINADATHLHNLEGELGPLGQSKHEESMFGGFRPIEWE